VVKDSGIGFVQRRRDGLRIGNRVGGIVRNGILTFVAHKKCDAGGVGKAS
jgi:hypothetical protein